MLDFHIRNVWQKIARMYNANGQKEGLSMSWGYVLLNIDNKKGTPSTKLGPKMGMESTSLSRILKNMETKGYILRESDPSDGRLSLLFLTSKGLKARNFAKKNVFAFNRHIYGAIPPKKIAQCIEVMTELNTILDTHIIFENQKITG